MQKILSKEQRERRSKRNQLIIGIILVGLMIISTGGYAIMNNEDNSVNSGSVKYNGITFYSDGIYWKFIYNQQNFATEYNPNQTQDIQVPITATLSDYDKKVLYFVTESGEPNNEIYRNLYPFILKSNAACIEGLNCTGNFPLKNCSTDNIIIIKETLENESETIYQNQKCIFINSNYSNHTRFMDAFLFKILDI